jgi:hypothetical protein
MTEAVLVRLKKLAHARSGDKGNRLNIALICWCQDDYEIVARQITEARVAALFAYRNPTSVRRYELPKLAAFNFVLDDVLEGGVNSSLGLDGHGKSLSFVLTDSFVEIGPSVARRLGQAHTMRQDNIAAHDD